MTDTNFEMVRLMKELQLSCADVAKQLDVPLDVVTRWTETDSSKEQEIMPEADLRLLKYALMSENKHTHLF